MAEFDTLRAFDPELAARLSDSAADWPQSQDVLLLDAMAGDILDGVSVEPAFGLALAEGLIAVAREGGAPAVARYRQHLTQFVRHGPTLGGIMARALVPVTRAGDEKLLKVFLAAVAIMRRKGTHTLADPLAALNGLLDDNGPAGAVLYLRLLEATFSRELTYNRAAHLTKHLPRVVLRLHRTARSWQIPQLSAAMSVDDRLAERLWESLVDRDLGLLSEEGLAAFVAEACRRWQKDPESGRDFAALRSRQGRETCRALRVAVPLTEMRGALGAYAGLRLGRGCAIRPVSDLPGDVRGGGAPPMVRSDGRAIYLSDVVNAFPDARLNRACFQCLVRLECGVLECGTHDFDMDKAADRLGVPRLPAGRGDPGDLACWFQRYAAPGLAAYLFSIFELARVNRWSLQRYPGILRQVAPFVEYARARTLSAWPDHPFTPLVVWSADPGRAPITGSAPAAAEAAISAFDAAAPDAVEDTAVFLDSAYPALAALVNHCPSGLPDPLFGRLIHDRRRAPDLVAEQRLARRVQDAMAHQGVPVYRSEIIRQYRKDAGTITPEGMQQAAARSAQYAAASGLSEGPMGCRPAATVPPATEFLPVGAGDPVDDPVFWYPEWDGSQGDYRSDHVRVRVGRPFAADAGECAAVLSRRHHLVTRIRRAFELLRPQGVALLRRWVEGDDFDYRALVDFAVDRRTGRTPSERVYLKRLKAHRDVATLLLVDQSRSTRHPAAGIRQSVMDVEKEAIVLFCEALGVLGDRFAVAGFSGAGRLGVDYYWVKTFDDAMGAGVWARIAGMTPLRSTRMGAAIRHATAAFEAAPAAVRLLIVLGDGFPNDVDYKKGYAVEDTRKAVQEAHARHIHTHGITVNIASDAGLDALYGGSAHTVISDVRELPDALWRVYANLTRR